MWWQGYEYEASWDLDGFVAVDIWEEEAWGMQFGRSKHNSFHSKPREIENENSI